MSNVSFAKLMTVLAIRFGLNVYLFGQGPEGYTKIGQIWNQRWYNIHLVGDLMIGVSPINENTREIRVFDCCSIEWVNYQSFPVPADGQKVIYQFKIGEDVRFFEVYNPIWPSGIWFRLID